jgi:tRNA-specific 2-thiouridylase
LPLGQLSKETVRELAQLAQLPLANKAESQDICFAAGGDYQEFLRTYLSANISLDESYRQTVGEIVDSMGNVLGYHQGIENFTIGQRRGLGVSFGQPLYVTRIDGSANRVVVGPEARLYGRRAMLRDLRSPLGEKFEATLDVMAKYRYRSPAALARLVMLEDGRYEVHFLEAQKALTLGQALVCYQGDEVLAGGIIDEVRS